MKSSLFASILLLTLGANAQTLSKVSRTHCAQKTEVRTVPGTPVFELNPEICIAEINSNKAEVVILGNRVWQIAENNRNLIQNVGRITKDSFLDWNFITSNETGSLVQSALNGEDVMIISFPTGISYYAYKFIAQKQN